MTLYAQIIIDISREALDHPFTYRIPEMFAAQAAPGLVAEVPFGRGNSRKKGYILELTRETSLEPERIKDVIRICTDEQTTEAGLIAMAAWLRKTYGSTMNQALRTALPVREKVMPVKERFLVRSAEPGKLTKAASKLSPSRYRARIRILEALTGTEYLDYRQAVRDLGLTQATVRYLEEEGLAQLEGGEKYRLSLDASSFQRKPKASLSPEQESALGEIVEKWDRPVLLYGLTGSGKTLIYMELIDRMLAQGKQTIVLIPEIALTYQTAGRFYERFGSMVSVINSQLSAGQRYDQFRRARSGDIQIMVGPRSALFTPFPRLGLIVMDEEHEPSYKSEHSPCYHTREAAAYRASQTGAHFVMGSATPSLEAFSRAQKGEYAYTVLTSRFAGRRLPHIEIVDMRKELREGNRTPISIRTAKALQECLEGHTQAILFLNRRGYAGFVCCRDCGAVMKCPHCDVSLSEHEGMRLVCHYCGYESPLMDHCPSCGSSSIGRFRAGTQQIEKQVQKMFPQSRLLRMDYDTTRRKGSYEDILKAFAAHEADILIGTQMIVKGHDFPHVTLVAALSADLSLNSSDYRSAERTFQLLVQAAGRAGRGEKAGTAIFQTYQPDHYSIQTAAAQDYEMFYEQELSYRRLLGYPPAASMLMVQGSGRDEAFLDKAMGFIALYARRLAEQIADNPSAGYSLTVIGPAPASIGKIQDRYYRSVYVKGTEQRILIRLREKIEKYIEINEGFRTIMVKYDIQ
ncbi:MAG: primosomal protein N' [Blautia sp.]|nr:primosomal protein N' [Blautia sp.]